MIITGKSLSLPGVMPTEQQGNRSDGGLTTVKTDGITITGDGNTTPLELGPGEKDSIGGYVLARCPYLSGLDYGTLIAGGWLSPATYTLTYGISYQGTLSGTYRFCCMAGIAAPSLCLVQRVA
ncbi:hypothetical protein [Salmonella enterica]|uniref:hypothetical protein n=1 Tax=Salmonella enterica TaxID=28901 RepID=UPI003D322BB1